MIFLNFLRHASKTNRNKWTKLKTLFCHEKLDSLAKIFELPELRVISIKKVLDRGKPKLDTPEDAIELGFLTQEEVDLVVVRDVKRLKEIKTVVLDDSFTLIHTWFSYLSFTSYNSENKMIDFSAVKLTQINQTDEDIFDIKKVVDLKKNCMIAFDRPKNLTLMFKISKLVCFLIDTFSTDEAGSNSHEKIKVFIKNDKLLDISDEHKIILFSSKVFNEILCSLKLIYEEMNKKIELSTMSDSNEVLSLDDNFRYSILKYLTEEKYLDKKNLNRRRLAMLLFYSSVLDSTRFSQLCNNKFFTPFIEKIMICLSSLTYSDYTKKWFLEQSSYIEFHVAVTEFVIASYNREDIFKVK